MFVRPQRHTHVIWGVKLNVISARLQQTSTFNFILSHHLFNSSQFLVQQPQIHHQKKKFSQSVDVNALPGDHTPNPSCHASLQNIHSARINTFLPIHLGNKPSVFESPFLRMFSPTWDSLKTKLQSARLRWRRGGGGVHFHARLMVRLLQITHDTSSDDIFQPPPC